MKISNETKIGALTAIAITFLILGFNFLKGKSLFKTGTYLYAKYTDTKELKVSNAVYINGFQIGSVAGIDAADDNLTAVVVEIKLNGDYNIPDNSIAEINASLLGSPAVIIKSGSSTSYLKPNDTLMTRESAGLLGDISNKLSPVADQLQLTLKSLDSLLQNFNTMLDPNTKGNLQSVMANLNKATASIAISAVSLQSLLNNQSGALSHSLNNLDSFTKNLAGNNEKISSMLSNIDKTTENLSKADIDGAINSLKGAVEKLNNVMAKVNSTDGTIGALVNSKDMYNNLNSTVRSLNILMDDLRAHPKRYVNISVFGKKDKGDYLTEPLKDSTSSPEKK
ncbi:MCE family protein [Panacibacter ginsenosidivorans]|uniref:MCE family protein n=1 Tax=Panacibacter ginsenosidivorans TaxID=1813871 RepID=A0A5B8VBV4_9BACT|nr:MlaD family protein [Panacibacter ginsenosidivorans]QEC68990.1 MCE family protein [Panacibacter ginsenosidivorans]